MVLRKEITTLIKDILKKNPQGMSITEIVQAANINRNTAGRYLENLLVSGQVEMRRFGMAKIYMLSRRVPLSAVLSISSDMVLQLDNNLRITFVNQPFLDLIGTDEKELLGKNIEYTSVGLFFDDLFSKFVENIRKGIEGKELSGEIVLPVKNIILSCRIAPTVFDDGRKGVSVIFEDITERKKAETELQESQDRYRTLVEISPDAVFLHREGKFIYANPAALTLLGASHPGQIIGKSVLDFILPEFRDVVRKNIEKDLEGGTSSPTELRMLRVDGTSILVEGRGIGTIIDGKPAVQVAIRDITEQRRAEEKLKKSEDLYRTLAETSPDLIFVIDRNDRVEYVNTFASAMVKKTADQIIGGPRSVLFPPEVARNQKKALDIVFETATPIRNEGVLQFSDQIHWFDHFLTPLKDADNHVRSVLGISRDITQRKLVEQALRESEEKYRSFIDRANDGICVVQDRIIKMCNNRAAEFWGDTSEEIVGRPFTDFIHPASLADVTDRYYRRMGGEKIPSIYETILKRKDGSRFYAEVNASVISFDGKPADFIIIRDMNDRKKSAEVLQKSEDNYRTLAEASTDLIFVIDRDDRVEYVNSYASAFVSKPVDQIIGGPRSALFPPEVAGNQKKALEKVFGTGVPFRNETLLTFAGREHWFDHSLIPLKDADNYVRSVLGISRDITEQKNTEKKLRDSEQSYQRLLEQSFDAIAIHKDRKIAYINKRATEILGAASPDELIGRPVFDLIHPDSRRVLEDRLEKLNADPGIPVPITTERFFRVNGTTVPVEVMAIRFDDNGTPAIRVVFREIASGPDRQNVSKKRGAGSK